VVTFKHLLKVKLYLCLIKIDEKVRLKWISNKCDGIMESRVRIGTKWEPIQREEFLEQLSGFSRRIYLSGGGGLT
jgi:hypothetical protein